MTDQLPDDLRGAEFVDTNLRGARFTRADLTGVVMRGVDVDGADIDAPWLLDDGGALHVNGVDVAPFVDAELNRRFPGRAERRAGDPAALQAAWARVEAAWAGTLARVARMPEGTVDVSIDGEWSFAQTLRHLVMATDTWLGRTILGLEKPYHPIGQPNVEYATDGHDPSVFMTGTPPFADVLEVRAGRVAMVRDHIAGLTPEALVVMRPSPWSPEHEKTTLACLHTILEEEWEHHRYAVRDLDTIDRRGASEAPIDRIAGAALVRDGRILLGHRHPRRQHFANCWDIVGGHIEPGETPADAIRRECREELGIDIEDPRPMAMTVSDPHLEMHAFVVTSWSGHPENTAPDEHDELRWFSPDELSDLVLAHPQSLPDLVAATMQL